MSHSIESTRRYVECFLAALKDCGHGQENVRAVLRELVGEPDAALRDYFIANAPAEPQPWFTPVMPTERPQEPKLPDEGDAERSYVREYRRVLNPDEVENPALRAYVQAFQSCRKQAAVWDAEAAKQRYVQWPAAWADEMLRARSAP